MSETAPAPEANPTFTPTESAFLNNAGDQGNAANEVVTVDDNSPTGMGGDAEATGPADWHGDSTNEVVHTDSPATARHGSHVGDDIDHSHEVAGATGNEGTALENNGGNGLGEDAEQYGREEQAAYEANEGINDNNTMLENEFVNNNDAVDGFTNQAQVGGDFRLGVDQEMVGGQPVVEGYETAHVCGGWGNTDALAETNVQEGGGVFNFITHPVTGMKLSIYGGAGKKLLKNYVKLYKSLSQSGGRRRQEEEDEADFVDSRTNEHLFEREEDEEQRGGAGADLENPGANTFDAGQPSNFDANLCNREFGATQPEWSPNQLGGGCGSADKKDEEDKE
jgi:hypothetical protein